MTGGISFKPFLFGGLLIIAVDSVLGLNWSWLQTLGTLIFLIGILLVAFQPKKEETK